jgi:hypothetical protein
MESWVEAASFVDDDDLAFAERIAVVARNNCLTTPETAGRADSDPKCGN